MLDYRNRRCAKGLLLEENVDQISYSVSPEIDMITESAGG